MSGIKAILFDLGGTLLHYHDPRSDARHPFKRMTYAGIQNIYEHLLASDSNMQRRADFDEIAGKHIQQMVSESQKNLSGATVEIPIRAALVEAGARIDDETWKELRKHFYAEIDRMVFEREGLHNTLNTLHEAGYQLGIISNTMWAADLHDRHLAERDLMQFFPIRAYSCDTPHVKPHPTIFRGALALMGVAPEEAVYVGDRLDVDIAGAQGAGLRGVLIESPYRTETFDSIQADATIGELPELVAVLEEWRV